MTKAAITIIAAVRLFACQNPQAKTKTASPVFDEAPLKEFVLNSVNTPDSRNIFLLDSFILLAGPDSLLLHQTIDYLSKPFFDPNSRFRNESIKIRILEMMTNSPWYDSLARIRPKAQLALAKQNRPGNPANDFTYIPADNTNKKLYDLRSPNTLLFFYNPECPACKDLKKAMSASTIINKNIREKNLQVLAVYTETDLALWKEHLHDMPPNWTVAHDSAGVLYAKSVYDLKAIPTVYLLDKNKTVILKDCISVPLIEQALQ